MRSEFKMILAGFGAGALIGIAALTSVSASIDRTALVRADRQAVMGKVTISYGDPDPAMSASHVELIGDKGAVVEYRNTQGRIVYRSDPAINTTLVAKNEVIPSVTVLERSSQ